MFITPEEYEKYKQDINEWIENNKEKEFYDITN